VDHDAARVRIVGLGNVLMTDDAFGPYLVRVLEAGYEFPPGVSVLDAGTPGLDLVPFVEGATALVVIDTVRAAGPAGQVRVYGRDDILRHSPQARLSPHDPGLKETLLALEFAGTEPHDVTLVGCTVADASSGIGLTEPVRAAVPAAVEAVLATLARLGVPARPRVAAPEPDIWWER